MRRSTVRFYRVTLAVLVISATGRIVIAQDCNGNGIDDACDLDCGPTGGACDVAGCGGSVDCQLDGIPDECQEANVAALGNRYLAISVSGPDLDPNSRYAIDVYPESLGCQERCVQSDGTLGSAPCVFRTPSEWCRVLVHDETIIPGPYAPGTPQNYAAVARTEDQGVPWVILGQTDMPVWGDVAGPPQGGVVGPPDGQVNLTDILAVLARFANAPGAPPVEQVDLAPPILVGDCAVPDGRADVTDVFAILHAFAQLSYPCLEPCFGGQ